MKKFKISFKSDSSKATVSEIPHLKTKILSIPMTFWVTYGGRLHYGLNHYNKTVTGTAYCNLATDDFSKETGLLIARTKAETKVYKLLKKNLEQRRKLLKEEVDAIDEFLVKADNCIKHNEKFIQEKFIDKF